MVVLVEYNRIAVVVLVIVVECNRIVEVLVLVMEYNRIAVVVSGGKIQ